jgi:2-iminoacetate synthase ThiH
MLNEPLEQYKKMYSETLQAFLDLHNYHYEFLEFKRLRRTPGKKLRNHLRKLKNLYYDMIKVCAAAEKLQREIAPPPLGAPKKPVTKRPRKEDRSRTLGRPRKAVTKKPRRPYTPVSQRQLEQTNITKEDKNE